MLFKPDELPNGDRINPIPVVEPFQTARVNTEDQPVGTLLTHIAGMRWKPRLYFSQIKGKDEEQSSYQGKLRPINQQYRIIHDIELKVQSPAPNNPSVDDNQEIRSVGTAIAYPYTVIPIPGDMIIADTLDGRQAIYQVCDTVKPKSIFKRTAYEFEYVMYAWWTQALEDSLRLGVVAQYHFVRNNIDAGINPLIADEDWGIWTALEELERTFPMRFNTRFLSREYNSFLLPGQTTSIYDPFHASFCNHLFRPNGVSLFAGGWIMPTMDGSNASRLTIHTALLTLNPVMVDEVLQQVPIITSTRFLSEPFLAGVRFAGTQYVVYPLEDNSMLYSGGTPGYSSAIAMRLGVYSPPKASKRLPPEYLTNSDGDNIIKLLEESEVPIYTPISNDPFYIFPEAFYANDSDNMSLLESMLWSTLTRNQVDPILLLNLFHASREWTVLDQFYLQPFLYAMIPAAYRGI